MAEYAPKYIAADEAELIARARRKDSAAIRVIIKQHNQRLYRIARSIVRNDSDAEDVHGGMPALARVQHTFPL